jgi:hypothetical protein
MKIGFNLFGVEVTLVDTSGAQDVVDLEELAGLYEKARTVGWTTKEERSADMEREWALKDELRARGIIHDPWSEESLKQDGYVYCDHPGCMGLFLPHEHEEE